MNLKKTCLIALLALSPVLFSGCRLGFGAEHKRVWDGFPLMPVNCEPTYMTGTNAATNVVPPRMAVGPFHQGANPTSLPTHMDGSTRWWVGTSPQDVRYIVVGGQGGGGSACYWQPAVTGGAGYGYSYGGYTGQPCPPTPMFGGGGGFNPGFPWQ